MDNFIHLNSVRGLERKEQSNYFLLSSHENKKLKNLKKSKLMKTHKNTFFKKRLSL
jgi:hypothetical protein